MSDPVDRAGTVTFLLTDVECSVQLWESAAAAMSRAIPRYRELFAVSVVPHGVLRPPEHGDDGSVAVFARASDALAAAIDAQRALLAEVWPGGIDLRVRMALHTAEAQGSDGGVTSSRGVALRAIASGGQVMLSQVTHGLVVDGLPEQVGLVELGVHRLEGGRPETVFGVTDPSLPAVERLGSKDARPNNLPVALSSFIGRERELADVGAALTQTRLLTLTGTGGCGKTRLALRAAAAAAELERFVDGAWWVELAPLSAPDRVVRAVAQALGVGPLPGSTQLDACVLYLRSRRALLVLDNCEHLLAESAAVAQALLERCPQVTVLATSREPLRLAGESDWQVPSLSLPGADTLAGSDAVALFVDRARRVRPNFQVTDANAGAVAGICRGLEGIPLALELAAARARMMSLEQILAGLDDRFRLLSGGSRGALPRHQTLRASVQWSHDLLSDDERVLFRRLAVFAGGFALDAAERVCAGDGLAPERILDLLASLVEKSLVQADDVDRAAVRYRLLETVRQYALEELVATGELADARDRHRDTYLKLARDLDAEMFSPRQGELLDALDADAVNLANAIEWAAATEPDKALALCDALSIWWRQRTRFAQADAAYMLALDVAPGPPTALRARVMVAHGIVLNQMGKPETATGLAETVLAAAENTGDAGLAARALWVIANAAIAFDAGAVLEAARRGAALALEGADRFAWRANTWNVGWVHYVREEGAQLERLMEEMLRDAERAHDRWAAMLASWLLAMPFYARGDHAGARRRFADTVVRSRNLGELMGEAVSLPYLALIDTHAGTGGATLPALGAMRDRVLHAGVVLALPWLDIAIGVARTGAGQLDAAREHLHALADLPGQPLYTSAWSSLELAEIRRLGGDAEAAAGDAGRALELADRLPNPWLAARARLVLARLAAARGDWGAADRGQHQALDAIAGGGFLLELPAALEAHAHIAAGLESWAEAARLLGAASRARDDLGLVAWPHQCEELEAVRAAVRGALGGETFDASHSDGAQLAPGDALTWVRRARGTRKRPTGGWESLTPTELEVVHHAASGLTTAETGARMFIAPGTVKVHLSHIYAKLGVRNRAELTREAARQPDTPEPHR